MQPATSPGANFNIERDIPFQANRTTAIRFLAEGQNNWLSLQAVCVHVCFL